MIELLYHSIVYVGLHIILNCMPATATEATFPNVVCFYQSWAQYYKEPMSYHAEDIPGYFCKDIVYAFIGLDDDGMRIKVLDYHGDIASGGFQKAVALKQRFGHLKVLVAIGGWNEDGAKYSAMAASLQKRTAFVRNVLDFLAKHGFNGLNIYWNYPGAAFKGGRPEDKINFVNLVKELRKEFRIAGYKLTATIPANPYILDEGYDILQLNKYLDEFYVSGYELRGPWTNFTGVHSPLFGREDDTSEYKGLNINAALNYIKGEGPLMKKVIVGLPLFGISYTLSDPRKTSLGSKTSGGGAIGPYSNAAGMLSFQEICGPVRSRKWSRGWDSFGCSPYAYHGDQWVGYEDERSLKLKVEYLKANNYSGIMVWALNFDDYTGQCGSGKYPLLTSLFEGLVNRTNTSIKRYHNFECTDFEINVYQYQ